jgi:Asp-tRNA(Asn)/Glu-tRNA(Gln) amidotransferase A subunit family amidase
LAAAAGGAHEDGTRTQAGSLPVGLQIAGPAFSENRLLDAAHALEQAIGFAEGSARV